MIGTTPRGAAAVLESLSESRALAELFAWRPTRASRCEPDYAGLNYGEAVRVLIGDNLEGFPASDEETPQATPTDDPPPIADDPAPVADNSVPTSDDRQAFAQLDGNEDGVLSGTETRTVSKYDAGGNRLYPDRWTDEGSHLSILFTPDRTENGKSQPTTLVWQMPAEVSEIVVPFKFTDLPLP